VLHRISNNNKAGPGWNKQMTKTILAILLVILSATASVLVSGPAVDNMAVRSM
jgi:hypothetical protein